MISIPPSCDGVPVSSELRTIILSPILTVFEFTLVVVPFTVKLPSTIILLSNVLSPPIVSVPVKFTYRVSNDADIWSEPLITPSASNFVFTSESAYPVFNVFAATSVAISIPSTVPSTVILPVSNKFEPLKSPLAIIFAP